MRVISTGSPHCLTVDDSLLGQLAAAGRELPAAIPHSSAAALLRLQRIESPQDLDNSPGPQVRKAPRDRLRKGRQKNPSGRLAGSAVYSLPAPT